jgi:hypothetical protein
MNVIETVRGCVNYNEKPMSLAIHLGWRWTLTGRKAFQLSLKVPTLPPRGGVWTNIVYEQPLHCCETRRSSVSRIFFSACKIFYLCHPRSRDLYIHTISLSVSFRFSGCIRTLKTQPHSLNLNTLNKLNTMTPQTINTCRKLTVSAFHGY